MRFLTFLLLDPFFCFVRPFLLPYSSPVANCIVVAWYVDLVFLQDDLCPDVPQLLQSCVPRHEGEGFDMILPVVQDLTSHHGFRALSKKPKYIMMH